jgi:hypothetical protein
MDHRKRKGHPKPSFYGGMMNRREIKKLDTRIKAIRNAAQELKRFSGGIQAVDRNADRILASAKMLEINISDLLDLKTLSA